MSQYEVSSLHKSVSSYLHDSSHTSFKQSIPHHHNSAILNEEFSVGERIGSTCSDNVLSEITTDELDSTTSNTLSLRYVIRSMEMFCYVYELSIALFSFSVSSGIIVMCIYKRHMFVLFFSTGEVVPVVTKQEFARPQENISPHNLSVHTAVMISEGRNEMDNEVGDNDTKTTADNSKMASDDNMNSSSNNTTLIAEDNTEILQVQPMESPTISNSDTHPQPIITTSKENDQDDIVRPVSDQSTPSQSCEEISESITHSITQPKIIGTVL